ncbi:hypothetical protein T440DRAFT_483434 [Plenodomus tracheiphilus IPT5]|uniref:Uncharacterized protein n=1 Tax=Plenodomus tracheiphilus IPT5 TaxID=1408161 RepID=A0A6A7AQ41_9PLEO|nr:hypothetical protein T440DRAFT_483434 [Plenodomus tracheiphilus IPT5]
MFQRDLGRKAEDATPAVEPEHQSQALSAIETPQVPMRYDPTTLYSTLQSKTTIVEHPNSALGLAPRPVVYHHDAPGTAADPKDREILRLQRTLTEAKTADRARESQLRVAKEGLKNAREALNETFAEYTGLREELKTVKQVLGRDHQAVIYRKDIELFALRKINEQREKNLTQRDVQLEEMERQHQEIVEVKEEQLRLLQDRLAVMEFSGGQSQDKEDGDHALEVRLLKVKKGRKSLEVEDDKDAIILQLQEDLAVARRSAEAVVNQQAELQRAWDITKKIQTALKDERGRHTQTREQLEDMRVMFSADGNLEHGLADTTGRLPTIDEDEHDRIELEAMFDAAQKDNSDLNIKVSMLEKRLHDANMRLFSAAQEAEVLRGQARFEQARKHELEDARSGMVHQVRLQRIEDELKKSQEIVVARDDEIRRQRQSIAEIDRYVGRLRREIDAAIRFHAEDQDEIESLKQTISELESTKKQLIGGHEEQTLHRIHPRVTAAEPNTARCSGATLIQESSPQLTRSEDAPTTSPVEALRPMLAASEQRQRGRSHSHSTTNRPSALGNMVSSNDELDINQREAQTARRTSLGLRNMLKRIARKDNEESEIDPDQAAKAKQFDRPRMRNAFMSMTTNAISRPATTAATPSILPNSTESVSRKPIPDTATVPERMRPSSLRRTSMRYYAPSTAKDDERPQTVASKDVKASKHRSWGANVQTKLKRRSLY